MAAGAERPKGFGLTAELRDKTDSKYDPEEARKAIQWINAVTDSAVPLGKDEFTEVLKDGQILCELINRIAPGSVKKINTSKMAFKMMENIGKFLDGCYAYGCVKIDMFQTVDLYEAQNIPQFINGINTLGRKAAIKGFEGPVLEGAPTEATESKRDFSEEQLKAGQNVIGLQMGSNRGATQSGMTSYGAPRQIH